MQKGKVVLIRSPLQWYVLMLKTSSCLQLPTSDFLPFDLALLVAQKKILHYDDVQEVPIWPCEQMGLVLVPLPNGFRSFYLSQTVCKQHILFCQKYKPVLCDSNTWYDICHTFLWTPVGQTASARTLA